jgi:hypothetical protein
MDRQGSCAVVDRPSCSEAAVLSVLLNSDGGCVWAVEELVRELSTASVDVLDALSSLQGAGLIHRVDDFVFATRAARRFDRLDM